MDAIAIQVKFKSDTKRLGHTTQLLKSELLSGECQADKISSLMESTMRQCTEILDKLNSASYGDPNYLSYESMCFVQMIMSDSQLIAKEHDAEIAYRSVFKWISH